MNTALERIQLRELLAKLRPVRDRYSAELERIEAHIDALEPELRRLQDAHTAARDTYVSVMANGWLPTDYSYLGHPGYEGGQRDPGAAPAWNRMQAAGEALKPVAAAMDALLEQRDGPFSGRQRLADADKLIAEHEARLAQLEAMLAPVAA